MKSVSLSFCSSIFVVNWTEAHVRKVKSLFTNLDADESGYISLKELEQNMHKRSASWLKSFRVVGHLFWMEIDSQHSET